MKKSRLLVLAMAATAAGGAFLLANSPAPQAPVQAQAPAAAVPVPTDEVLTAAHDLPVGTVIADGDLAWQAWPKAAIAAGMTTRESDPKAVDDLKASIVRTAMFAGEPVHREKLIKGAGAGFMSAILPAGMRAVAINIDAQGSTTAGGFILPNDRVDVIHTFNETAKAGSATTGVVSETLLRNVRVLAIGQNVQDKNGTSVVVGSNATLELDPVEAEKVVLAQRQGQLSLTLRSVLDASKDEGAVARSEDRGVTVVRYGQATEGELR